MSRGNPEMQPGGWLGAGGWRPGASQGPRAGGWGLAAGSQESGRAPWAGGAGGCWGPMAGGRGWGAGGGRGEPDLRLGGVAELGIVGSRPGRRGWDWRLGLRVGVGAGMGTGAGGQNWTGLGGGRGLGRGLGPCTGAGRVGLGAGTRLRHTRDTREHFANASRTL